MSDVKVTERFIKEVSDNYGIIHKVCNIYCNTSEDKKDMMQEITLQLWKSYPNFQGKAKFSSWMYKIALNTVITNIRKSKRNPVMESLFENQLDIPDKEDIQNLDKDINRLYKAIAKLNDIDKAIIMLYLEEKTYKEIGEIIGISEKNVSVKLVRIKTKLEKLF